MPLSAKDRFLLRELAARQMQLAHSPRNQQLYQDWVSYEKNKYGARAMIRVEIETFEHQSLPGVMYMAGRSVKKLRRFVELARKGLEY